MAIAFLTTLAVQIGSACYNSSKSKKHAAEIARKQQAFEEKVAREGIENARAEFAELCSFQRKLEAETQQDRLNLIRTNHENSILQAAYETSLSSWPLMVPPYVIKNDTITSLSQIQQKAIPLNCILTTSTDVKFNKAVFYKLEEALACFCSRYWNISANKSIRFFQEAWRDNFKDVGSKHKDLYAHLSDVPTLVISPVIKNEKLIFRFYWWGLSTDPAEAHLNDIANELDPEVKHSFTTDKILSTEESERILSVCIPKLEAFISFFADQYYWNAYHIPPTLIQLTTKQIIGLDSTTINEYYAQYRTQFHAFTNGSYALNGLNDVWDAYSPSFENIEAEINGIVEYVQKMSLSYQDKELSSIRHIKSCVSTQSSLLDNLCEQIETRNTYHGEKLSLPENKIHEDVLSITDIESLKDMASQGCADAYFRLGEIFDCPIVMDYDPNEASKYFELAIANGCLLASIRNKIIKNFGEEITTDDVRFLQDNASVQSSIMLSWCYACGYGTECSPQNAMQELEQYAESNHPIVYFMAAKIVEKLYGSEQAQNIIELLYKASDLGCVKAQVELMNMYYSGQVLEANPNLCVEFAQKAALQGEPEALFTLAICLIKGYGIRKNKYKAMKFLQMAANRGYSDAIDLLKQL